MTTASQKRELLRPNSQAVEHRALSIKHMPRPNRSYFDASAPCVCQAKTPAAVLRKNFRLSFESPHSEPIEVQWKGSDCLSSIYRRLGKSDRSRRTPAWWCR
jgi:hypothetical protein